MVSEIVMLAPSLDDLYAGFNDYDPILDSKALQYDEDFQRNVSQSGLSRKGIRSGYKTSGPSRMGTSGFNSNQLTSRRRSSTTSMMAQNPSTAARPMTAVRGAGYTSRKSPSESLLFDEISIRKLFTRDDQKSKYDLKEMENKVNHLLEQSIQASDRKEFKLALDKAKLAVAKERNLIKQKEQLSSDSMSVSQDLTFAVLFNLSVQYTRNERYSDAINILQTLAKNRSFSSNSGRLKLNIGCVYYLEGNYSRAIKFFRMALDQIPTTQNNLRMRIMRNIGLVFVKLNQYPDALTSFEYIISEKGDYQDALHTIVCHFAVNDKENMKKAFLKLLSMNEPYLQDKFSSSIIIPEMIDGEDDDDDPQSTFIAEAIKDDLLSKWQMKKKQERDWCILVSAKLISPLIADNLSAGYEWCSEQVRLAGFPEQANDLEIDRAVKHLKKKEFNEAISVLKCFEKKENKAASLAATNLSFLHILQNDINQAEKYADDTINVDRFNCAALINKGNCRLKNGDYLTACEYFKEALSIESSSLPALYNLALSTANLGQYEFALNYLHKINNILPNYPNVLYQIASLYEAMDNRDAAIDWFQSLITFVPSDVNILNRLSDISSRESDRLSALSYLNDSHRYLPSHIPSIEKLAAYFIEDGVYEKAIIYLEKASIVEPNQVKWLLMIAACYRRSGNYSQAIKCYKLIHRKFPENMECVKFLVNLCIDLNLTQEAEEYEKKLQLMEKAKESKNRKSLSSRSGRASSRNQSRSNTRQTTETSNRADSASSNSSGYLTSSVSSKNGHKRKSVMDLIEGKKSPNTVILQDLPLTSEERPTTSWKRGEDDDFADEEIGDILPE